MLSTSDDLKIYIFAISSLLASLFPSASLSISCSSTGEATISSRRLFSSHRSSQSSFYFPIPRAGGQRFIAESPLTSCQPFSWGVFAARTSRWLILNLVATTTSMSISAKLPSSLSWGDPFPRPGLGSLPFRSLGDSCLPILDRKEKLSLKSRFASCASKLKYPQGGCLVLGKGNRKCGLFFVKKSG